jgi:hypothetical protein
MEQAGEAGRDAAFGRTIETRHLAASTQEQTMAVRTIKLGFQAKLYLGDDLLADVPGTGTWTEATGVKDASVTDEYDEVDVTTRATGGMKSFAPGLRAVSVDFDIEIDPDDDQYAALLAAYRARQSLAVAVLDGDKDDAKTDGIAGNWTVAKLSTSQGLNDHQMAKVSLKPFTYVQDW